MVEGPTLAERAEAQWNMLWAVHMRNKTQEESIARTELRAVLDVVKRIGYPNAESVTASKHVEPAFRVDTNPLVPRVRVTIPENSLHRKTRAFRVEIAVLEIELTNLIARVQTMMPSPPPERPLPGF